MEYICDIGISNDGVIVRRSHVRERIVRCKDCEYCTEEGIYAPQYYCNNMHWHYLSWQGTPTDPNGFCKWGKHKQTK